ncbi:MAG: Slp family lipoprotein [Desulfuromonadales bacterium]|nr:Slp family lipoprotein [Desulfuromonadales bacterium]
MIRTLFTLCAAVLVTGCGAPLGPEVRNQLDPDLDFAEVQAEPQRFQGKSLMLGGSIVSLKTDDEGSFLEILRWDLNRWGEPLALAEAGDRFLVYTPRQIDTDLYTRGRLVTLGGTLIGTADITTNERKESVLRFDLLGIHLWDTPFRYGLHPNPDPGAPEYVTPTDPGPSHPYDPTPWTYPYPPAWYRSK